MNNKLKLIIFYLYKLKKYRNKKINKLKVIIKFSNI